MTPVVPRTCDVCARAGRDRRTPAGKRHLHELEPGDRFRLPESDVEATVTAVRPGRVAVRGGPFEKISPTAIIEVINDE